MAQPLPTYAFHIPITIDAPSRSRMQCAPAKARSEMLRCRRPEKMEARGRHQRVTPTHSVRVALDLPRARFAVAGAGNNAAVVGAGPNGLSGAITLAQAGMSVTVYEAESIAGGGARTLEMTLPGFRHDFGSAVHPMAAGSPFFRELPLASHGLEWIH